MGKHGIGPPANRRVEFNGSGAPSGMMAQPQSAQGCAVCGAPSDPLDETREPAKRAVCRGRRLLVLLPKRAVFQKSLAPARRAGEILSRAAPSRPAWRSHANKERGKVSALRQTTKKPQPQGCGFFIGSTCWHQTPTRPTGLMHGASWFCRRCLPARCPSR